MTPHLADTPLYRNRAPDPARACAPVISRRSRPSSPSDRARFVGGGADKDIGLAWRILAIFSGHCTCAATASSSPNTGPRGGPSAPSPCPRRLARAELGWTIWD